MKAVFLNWTTPGLFFFISAFLQLSNSYYMFYKGSRLLDSNPGSLKLEATMLSFVPQQQCPSLKHSQHQCFQADPVILMNSTVFPALEIRFYHFLDP